MYHSILVPLDGSTVGEHALPAAIEIARRNDATLHLVHVRSFDLSERADFPRAKAFDLAAQDAERAYLAGVATRIADLWDGRVMIALREGMLAPALQHYAREERVDLVVMTTHGRGGLARAWLGNLSDDLVHALPIPILLVRPGPDQPDLRHAPRFTHILVPLDNTPLAEQIVDPVLALDDRPATLTLLYVVDPMLLEAMGTAYDTAPSRMQYAAVESSQHYLDQLAKRLERPDVRVQTCVMIGAAAPSILERAKTLGVDMIALATHGRSGLARVVLGSVADSVTCGTQLPVLLYHPVPQSTLVTSASTSVLEVPDDWRRAAY